MCFYMCLKPNWCKTMRFAHLEIHSHVFLYVFETKLVQNRAFSKPGRLKFSLSAETVTNTNSLLDCAKLPIYHRQTRALEKLRLSLNTTSTASWAQNLRDAATRQRPTGKVPVSENKKTNANMSCVHLQPLGTKQSCGSVGCLAGLAVKMAAEKHARRLPRGTCCHKVCLPV